MTNQPQTELDEILQQNIQFTLLGEFPNAVPDHNNWVNVMGRVYSFDFTEAKQALLDWHTAHQEQAVRDARIDEWDYIYEAMHAANQTAIEYAAETMRDRIAGLTSKESE